MLGIGTLGLCQKLESLCVRKLSDPYIYLLSNSHSEQKRHLKGFTAHPALAQCVLYYLHLSETKANLAEFLQSKLLLQSVQLMMQTVERFWAKVHSPSLFLSNSGGLHPRISSLAREDIASSEFENKLKR